MIKVLHKKLVKVDKTGSKYYVEMVCDEFDELPSPTQYDGWIIDMGSVVRIVNTGEVYMLNSDGDWISQKKNSDDDAIFTQADRLKLDSLTNPILLKGRVDSYGDLQKIKNPETGWLYFVGEENDKSFAEYIFTESGAWEYVGDNSIDLSEYVKFSDHATNSKHGIIKGGSSGWSVDSNGSGYIVAANENQTISESGNYNPLVPQLIPVFMKNYGIAHKTTIGEMQEQEALNKASIGLQRKNYLMNRCTTYNRNGLDIRVNENGSITLKGNNTLGSDIMVFSNFQTGAGSSGQTNNNKKFIPTGDYILSGGGTGYRIQICANDENAEHLLAGTTVSDQPGETKFTITDEHKYSWTRLIVYKDADFGEEGITIYPMIRPADITDSTYEPYKPSLQEQISDLEARLAALEAPQAASTLLPDNLSFVEEIPKDKFPEQQDEMV